jgi:hypothetical protein
MGLTIVAGDSVRIAKSPDPVNTGINATWVSKQKYITLASALTQLVDDCESGWTQQTNCTVTYDTTLYKSGSKSLKMVTSGSFTTGKLAQLTSGVNGGTGYTLSAYQQLSFWLYSTAAIAANVLQIILYSDVACTSVLATFNVPQVIGTATWYPLTVDLGSSISGTTVKGIAVSAASTFASQTVYIDNINVCYAPATAGAITLQSLLSQNNAVGNTEGWYPIQSINGTTVYLDGGTAATPATTRGYWSTTSNSGAVALYRRETTKFAAPAAQTTAINAFSKSGTAASPIAYSGGWNTSSGLQDGETWWDALCGWGGCIVFASNYCSVDKMAAVRSYYGLSISSAAYISCGMFYGCDCSYAMYISGSAAYGWTITTLVLNNNNNTGSSASLSANGTGSIGTVYAMNNVGLGANLYVSQSTIGAIYCCNNSTIGLYCSNGGGSVVKGGFSKDNGTYGISGAATGLPTRICNFVTSGNTTAGFGGGLNADFYNCLFSDTTVSAGFTPSSAETVTSTDHQQTSGNSWTFVDGGQWYAQATTRHTSSGVAWRMVITGTNRMAYNPITMPVARIAVQANLPVTVTAWVEKDDANKIQAQLICPANQIAGVTSDVTSASAANASWQQLSITFTPTEIGVVDIFLQAWYVSGTGNVYVDDVAFTQ